jgi:hypothetical protein
MDRSPIAFRWSDAWLLLAVGIAAREAPASLASVIKVADGLQHAVPVKEEVDGALSRLSRAGLLAYSDAAVRLLPAGRALISTAQQSTRVHEEQQHALEIALNASPWEQARRPRDARGDEPEIISPAEWDGLMAPYRRTHR